MTVNKVRNLTPHQINLVMADGPTIAIPADGMVARVAQTREKLSESVQIGGVEIEVHTSNFGEVYDLPEPVEGTILITSLLVAQAVKGTRNDVFIVDDTVRDENGRIVGCRGFGKV